MVFPRQLGSGWPRKVVFSPCDTGTLARLVKLAAAAAISAWGKWGGAQEMGGGVLEASGSSPEPPPRKRALTPYCPLLAACDGPGSGGGLEAVLRSQVPSSTCVQIQVLPLQIYAAASRDFTSLLQFPWVLKEFNRGISHKGLWRG